MNRGISTFYVVVDTHYTPLSSPTKNSHKNTTPRATMADSLTTTLLNAQSPVEADRRAAEATLKAAEQSNLAEFFIALSTVRRHY